MDNKAEKEFLDCSKGIGKCMLRCDEAGETDYAWSNMRETLEEKFLAMTDDERETHFDKYDTQIKYIEFIEHTLYGSEEPQRSGDAG